MCVSLWSIYAHGTLLSDQLENIYRIESSLYVTGRKFFQLFFFLSLSSMLGKGLNVIYHWMKHLSLKIDFTFKMPHSLNPNKIIEIKIT